MKCVCGYEKITDWDTYELKSKLEEFPDFKNGDEDFKMSNSTINFQLREIDYYENGESNETIYACPKCGTLKIDI